GRELSPAETSRRDSVHAIYRLPNPARRRPVSSVPLEAPPPARMEPGGATGRTSTRSAASACQDFPEVSESDGMEAILSGNLHRLQAWCSMAFQAVQCVTHRPGSCDPTRCAPDGAVLLHNNAWHTINAVPAAESETTP